MSKTKNIRYIILTLIGVAVYAPGLLNPYYGDDYKFVFESPSSKLLYYFTHENSNAAWYRPVEAMVLSAIQWVWGLNPAPVHIVVLAVHISIAICVMAYMEKAGFASLSAFIAAVFMLCSQANALAVLSIDTLSQVGGTLFGCLSLWFLWKYFKNSTGQYGQYVISIVLFTLSLWMKETSLGFVVAVGCVFLFHRFEQESRIKVLHGIKLFLPYVLITLMYVFVRANIISREPDVRYAIHFGINIIENIAMLLFAATTAISTVSVFLGFASKDIAVIGFSLLTSVGIIAIVTYGVWKSTYRKIGMGLFILAAAVLLPAFLISHVSELYIYSAMPFISSLVGIGFGSLYQQKARFIRIGLIGFAALIVSLNVYAIRGKSVLMGENGSKESELLAQVLPLINRVPMNGTLVLVNPASQAPQYSVYLMNGFNVFKYGESVFHYASGRTDFRTWIIDEQHIGQSQIPVGSLMLIQQGTPPTVVTFEPKN